MNEVLTAIDGTTRLAGLIGNPVEHSVSPQLHGLLAQRCGINMAYAAFCVEKDRLEEAVKGAFALNMAGVNVTVPYKNDVIPFLEQVDPLAAAVGSVNTLVRTERGFAGYNTDMSGLYRGMQEDGFLLEGRQIAVIGAGGVGRAVTFLCAQKGAEHVWLLNRSLDKAQAVAEEVRKQTGRDCVTPLELAEWEKLPERVSAIQATSVGLYPQSDRAAIEEPGFYERVSEGYDLIYRPADTKFMQLVRRAGGRAFNGLKMLVYQGVEAFELWNGVTVHAEVTAQVYEFLQKKVAVQE